MKRTLILILTLCSCMVMAQTGIPNAKPTNSQFFTNGADTSQVWLYPGAPYKAKRLLTYGSIVGGVASVFGRSGAVTALQADYSAYYKPLNYVPDWSEVANKPSFFSGSYTDLANKPTLFSGSYTDLSNKPVIFSGTASQFAKGDGTFATIQAADVPTLNQNTTGSAAKLNNQDGSYYLDYTHLTNSPDNLSFFKDGILANYDGVGIAGNSSAGSKQYIVTNMQGGGFNETDYVSIPGIAPYARGGHAFYTYNKQGGNSGGLLFDFGTYGDAHTFVTGSALVIGTVQDAGNPTYLLTNDANLGTNEVRKVPITSLMQGSSVMNYYSTSGSYTATITNHYIEIYGSGTITLPNYADGARPGMSFEIINIYTSPITVTVNGAAYDTGPTINGNLTDAIATGKSKKYVFNGDSYRVLSYQ